MSKDWVAGILTLQWLLRYFGNGKVILTAPTNRQVKEVMFGEITKQYDRLREVIPEFKESYLTKSKLDFLEITAKGGFYGCCGDPAYTYSDVERVLAHWITDSNLIEKYSKKLISED